MQETGYLHFESEKGFIKKQNGVVRVNCVDCLDR